MGDLGENDFMFMIYLSSGRELSVEAKRWGIGWKTGDPDATSNEMRQAYGDLCRQTVVFRMKKYEEIHSKTGLWWLGDEIGYDVHLSENGDIYKNLKLFANWKTDAQGLGDWYGHNPWHRCFRKKPKNLSESLKDKAASIAREFSESAYNSVLGDAREVSFSTAWDNDIRDFLLENRIGLHWTHGKSLVERTRSRLNKVIPEHLDTHCSVTITPAQAVDGCQVPIWTETGTKVLLSIPKNTPSAVTSVFHPSKTTLRVAGGGKELDGRVGDLYVVVIIKEDGN